MSDQADDDRAEDDATPPRDPSSTAPDRRSEHQPGPQLVFNFPARPALGRADFLVAPCNATAVAWVDRWPDWPGATLALVGPAGCGKTHLAHVLAARAGALIVEHPTAADLHPAATLDRAATVVVERDPAGQALSAETEEALLHLMNLTRERGGSLLLTARSAPVRWPVVLPDLRSRLLALPVAEITPPDETLLETVLVKLFADRQVIVVPAVVRVLASRMERSFAAACDLVERLDTLAWARGRPISVALAREVLGASAGIDGEDGDDRDGDDDDGDDDDVDDGDGGGAAFSRGPGRQAG